MRFAHCFTRSLSVPFVVAAAALVAAATPPPQDAAANARILRVYDVSLLVEPVADQPGPSLEPPTADGGGIWIEPAGKRDPAFDPRGLVSLIRGSIEPDTWRHEAARCEVIGTSLQVVQTAEVQDAVAGLLSRLRREVGLVVEADVAVWQVTPAQSAALLAGSKGGSGVYSAGGATAALRAMQGTKQLDRATVVMRARQRASAANVRARAYVGDYDVEVATSAATSAPVVKTQRSGLVADCRALPSRDGTRVKLECRLDWAELMNLDRTFESAAGRVELPERRTTRVRGLAGMAYGEEWCAGATGPGGSCVVFVVSAQRRLPAGAAAPKAAGGGRRVTRVYSILDLTYKPSVFRLDSLESVLADDDAAAGAIFVAADAEGAAQLDPEAVAELIRANLDADSWDHPRNRIETRGHTLLVTHTPAMQEAVATYLAGLEAARPAPLRIESALVAPDAALEALLAKQGVEPLPDAAVRGWLAGAGARVVAHASVSGRNTQRVGASVRHDVPVVGGYDVEVAEKAEFADPAIRVGVEGFALDARPLLSGDGRNVSLKAHPQWASIRRPVREVETPHGVIMLMEPISREAELTPVLPSGAWSAQRFGRDAQGRELVLLTSVRRTR